MPAPGYQNLTLQIPPKLLSAILSPGSVGSQPGVTLGASAFPDTPGFSLSFGNGLGNINIFGVHGNNGLSGNENVDLTSIPDFNGNLVNFADIEVLFIWNKSTIAGQNLFIGGAASNPWLAMFNGTSPGVLIAPAAPVPTTVTTGGTVAANTYYCVVTYVNGAGETVGSAQGSVVTTGATSTITVPSPPVGGNATGWKAYIGTVNTGPYFVQGGTNTIGTALTLTTTPVGTGANPPTTNTATAPPLIVPPSATNPSGTTNAGMLLLTAPQITSLPVSATSKILQIGAGAATIPYLLGVGGLSS